MGSIPAQQFSDWARAIRASDHRAYAALYDALHGPLLHYAFVLTRDEERIYDILQDAFLKLWQIRNQLDPERSVKALLFRMVRNLALKKKRWQELEVHIPMHLSEHDNQPSPAEQLDVKDLKAFLQTWIAEMPERRLEVFELSRVSGMTHREIATVLDISPKTVNAHLVQALRHLRSRMHAYGLDLEQL